MFEKLIDFIANGAATLFAGFTVPIPLMSIIFFGEPEFPEAED